MSKPLTIEVVCPSGKTWNDGFNVRHDCDIDAGVFYGITWTTAAIGTIMISLMTVHWVRSLQKFGSFSAFRASVKNRYIFNAGWAAYIHTIGLTVVSLLLALDYPGHHPVVVIFRCLGLCHLFLYFFIKVVIQVAFLGLISKSALRWKNIAETVLPLDVLVASITGLSCGIVPVFSGLYTDQATTAAVVMFNVWAWSCVLFVWPLFLYSNQYWKTIPDSTKVLQMRAKMKTLSVMTVIPTSGNVIFAVLSASWPRLRTITPLVFQFMCLGMSIILPLVSWVLLKKGENMLRYSNDPRDPAMLSTTRSSTGNVMTSSKITPMSAVTNLSAVRIVTMSSPVWHAPEQQLTIQEEEEEGEEAEEAPAV